MGINGNASLGSRTLGSERGVYVLKNKPSSGKTENGAWTSALGKRRKTAGIWFRGREAARRRWDTDPQVDGEVAALAGALPPRRQREDET